MDCAPLLLDSNISVASIARYEQATLRAVQYIITFPAFQKPVAGNIPAKGLMSPIDQQQNPTSAGKNG
ncbi:MAG: hypothetical protein CMJ91_05575 [Planctomycetes bacterium]|nr:hypothetical protein [Planctomycetota bacterium]